MPKSYKFIIYAVFKDVNEVSHFKFVRIYMRNVLRFYSYAVITHRSSYPSNPHKTRLFLFLKSQTQGQHHEFLCYFHRTLSLRKET